MSRYAEGPSGCGALIFAVGVVLAIFGLVCLLAVICKGLLSWIS